MKPLQFTIRPLNEVLHPQDLGSEASLVDRVYGLLRRRIIDLSLPPELPLVEKDVADILQASKTPVREALIKLSREGLVNVVPKSGSYVTPISIDRYLQACFMRSQLEVGCVRRLARVPISHEGIARLYGVIAEQKKALAEGSQADFFLLDEKFHSTLFELAGLSDVWHALHAAQAELDRIRHLKRLFGVRRPQSVLQEHGAIVKAIEKRDADLVEAALLENIGGLDAESTKISEHPHLIQTIDDLNALVAHRRKADSKRKVA